MNLLVFGNVLVFFQRCSSDKRCQLRISKEFQRLPDRHRRLLRAQLHPQGCYQQIGLAALSLGVAHRRSISSVPRPRLFGRHFGTDGGEPAAPPPVRLALTAPGGAWQRRPAAGTASSAGRGAAGGSAPAWRHRPAALPQPVAAAAERSRRPA